jgi:hypothetical protein
MNPHQPYSNYAPPGYVAPPPPKTRKDFWLRGPGIVILFVAAGILIGVPLAIAGISTSPTGDAPAGSGFDVQVTSCEMTGDSLSSATVGLIVTNNQKRADSVRIEVEFRDGSGRRIDTDTAYIRDVAPGDTVKHEESTLLNATPTGRGTCQITSIR